MANSIREAEAQIYSERGDDSVCRVGLFCTRWPIFVEDVEAYADELEEWDVIDMAKEVVVRTGTQ